MIEQNDKSLDDSSNGKPFDTPMYPIDQPIADLDALIADMFGKFTRLTRYIDDHWDDLNLKQLLRILSVHSRCGARLGNILLNQQRAPLCANISETTPTRNSKKLWTWPSTWPARNWESSYEKKGRFPHLPLKEETQRAT